MSHSNRICLPVNIRAAWNVIFKMISSSYGLMKIERLLLLSGSALIPSYFDNPKGTILCATSMNRRSCRRRANVAGSSQLAPPRHRADTRRGQFICLGFSGNVSTFMGGLMCLRYEEIFHHPFWCPLPRPEPGFSPVQSQQPELQQGAVLR